MLHVDTTRLDLTEVWWESAPNQRVNVTFPINRFAGSEDSAVVYFEVAPGDRLPLHTDSPRRSSTSSPGSSRRRSATSTGASRPVTSSSSRRWLLTERSTSAARP